MYKYDYNICTEPDRDIFIKHCRALEKHIPNLVKDELLKDVDESETQIYYLDGKKILVHNCYYVGAVYIESEVDLEQFFDNK